jgi:putative ABC transport system permease protein
VPPAALAAQFRREVQALDPDLPIGNLWTLDQWLQWPHREQGNFTTLFLTFAVIALVLASIGLYAVIAHSVSQRTQEIGLRMAVGASAGDILKSVFKQGTLPLAIGLSVGLLASIPLNRVLQTQLVEVSSTDPVTYVVVCAVLIASALIGCLIPAHRAMRVDPLVALRHE